MNVPTYHYTNAETGANTSETLLTQADVNTTTFGKVASMQVDGEIYGQPLVMTNVPMANGQGTRDIVLITTENDSVYAFDAYGNNPAQGYLWKTSLLQAGETTVPEPDYGTTDITPQLGITGTPVVNQSTDVMYVVGLFKQPSADTYQQRLYALNIASGTNAIAPVVIAANVSGSTYTDAGGGYTNVNGVVSFSAFRENQRPALTLANGEVYVGWSSHGDEDPWHGWIMAYNASTLHQDYVYCNTLNGQEGGIWMSGGGIAVDSNGDLYVTTGNGSFDANTASGDYGMALEELSPTLQPLDYFAPYNQAALSGADLDYGCSNVILLPTQSGASPNEVLSAGKWGTIYLNNSTTGKLGEYNTNGTGPNADLGEATLAGANPNSSHVHNTMVYWNGYVYLGGDTLTLQAFAAGNGALGTTPSSQTSHIFGTGAEDGQGAGLTVSSNGSSNGIVWALDNSGFLNNPAVLYAYNAGNLNTLLWTSNQAANGRDTCGIGIKFQDPVVANGYVYVAGDGAVTVYGLINPSTATPTLVNPAAANPTTVTGTTTSLSVLATDPSADLHPIYTWSASTIPAGAQTPTFSFNGTNSANVSTATFYTAGAYTFTATIEDPNSGLTATSSVNVTVSSVVTGLTVSPSMATLYEGNTQQLSAATVDQFGNATSNQPNFTWTVSGGAGGTVSSTGLYTAPASATGSDTVTATAGSLSASATLTVVLASATIPVNLSGYYNTIGIVTNGVSTNGGLDNGGSAYSGNLLGTSQVWTGSTFSIPAATPLNNSDNVIYGTGQTLALSQNKYSAIKLLAAHLDGNAPNLNFTVTYTDGTTQTFVQSCSDWFTPQNYAGEAVAVAMAYRVNGDGTIDNRPFDLYGYSFTVNLAKTVRSITLPNDNLENVVAVDLVGIANAAPTVTIPASANPSPVTGITTTLTALGSDPAGDGNPSYTWAATNLPTGATTPTYSINAATTANVSTATFYQAGTYTFTVTITDPTTALASTSSVNVVVNQTFSGIAVTPATASVVETHTQQFVAVADDQFGKALAGQPAFTWAVGSDGAGGSVSSAGLYTAPATAGIDTITGSSGGFVGSATANVTLPLVSIPVNLSSYFNIVGIVADGTTFGGAGGVDRQGSTFSGTLLGTTQTYNGSSFNIPATTAANNVNNVIFGTGQTIPLQQKSDVALKLLADHLNGNGPGIILTVNYTDGTTQTINQNFSDWYTPQNYTGESTVVTMPYRDNANGTLDNRTFYLYGYSFSLNSTKTLQSITLPNDNNFDIIAMDLVGVGGNPPTVTTPAAASPSTITGNTTRLSALGTDSTGDASPVYTWATTNLPSGATTPSFSANNAPAANVSTATFYQAGSYTFTVTITDPTSGLSATSNVNVTVIQTLTALHLTPTGPLVLGDGLTQQFTAVAIDQFGLNLSPQPTINWTVLNGGAGSVNGTGLYQAPAVGVGAVTVQATTGTFAAQAVVQLVTTSTATFYPTLAGWYRGGVWQGTSGSDGGTGYTSPAGNTVLIAKNPNGGNLRDPYLLFNISNAAFAGDTITGVTLSFNAAALNQAGPVAFGVYGVSNTSWGATTGDPAPAPNYTGATEIGTTQNVGTAQQSYGSYTFNLSGEVTNATNGLITLELNSPAVTGQETGIEVDNALNTPGVDPVITVSYTINQPVWLASGSQATWNSVTKVLNVTGSATIIGDPGTDQPIIQANGSSAIITINPTSALQIQIGGLSLTNGASAIVTSLGAARTATNHRVLVLGEPGAITAPLLNIDSASQLDLTDNDLVDHDASVSVINALLTRGFNANAGYWNGNGILSSVAAAGKLSTLGDANPTATGTFDNQTVGTSDVEIRYTYFGDANLDGHVDGSDYSVIDNGYLHQLTGFYNGDFNYDGVVDGSDYTLIDNTFNTQGSTLAAQIAAPATQVFTASQTTPLAAPNVALTTAHGSGTPTQHIDPLQTQKTADAASAVYVTASPRSIGKVVARHGRTKNKAQMLNSFSDVKIKVGE